MEGQEPIHRESDHMIEQCRQAEQQQHEQQLRQQETLPGIRARDPELAVAGETVLLDYRNHQEPLRQYDQK